MAFAHFRKSGVDAVSLFRPFWCPCMPFGACSLCVFWCFFSCRPVLVLFEPQLFRAIFFYAMSPADDAKFGTVVPYQVQ